MMFFLLCRNIVHPLKMVVKLAQYNYGPYLKELAKCSLEDSEQLSSAARQSLLSVRWETKWSWFCFWVNESETSLRHRSRGLLQCALRMKTYSSRFHLLLHLEEIQMEVDIRKYDLYNQTMTLDLSNKKLLTLTVSREDAHTITSPVFPLCCVIRKSPLWCPSSGSRRCRESSFSAPWWLH